jgi:hypothetical protein
LEGQLENINSVDIISITGQVVKQFKSDFDRIDIKSLANGVYFMKILSGENQRILRFIKE